MEYSLCARCCYRLWERKLNHRAESCYCKRDSNHHLSDIAPRCMVLASLLYLKVLMVPTILSKAMTSVLWPQPAHWALG